MKFTLILMKSILLFLFLINVNISLKADIYESFLANLNLIDSVKIIKYDTLRENNREIRTMITDNEFVNLVLGNDIKYVLSDSRFNDSFITYDIEQCNKNFVSISKAFYHHSFDFSFEGFNIFKFENKFYKLKMKMSNKKIDKIVVSLIKHKKLEPNCINEIREKSKYMSFYFRNSILYLNNPIHFQTCFIDIDIPFKQEDFEFVEIDL